MKLSWPPSLARTRPVNIAASLLSGVAIAAGLPPWGWWPLTIAGLAGWFWLIDTDLARTRRRRSFLVGLGWFVPSTLWMIDLTAPGWPVVVIAFSGMAAIVGWATPHHGPRGPMFVAAIVLMELFRANFPFGGVPVATLAMVGVSTPMAGTVRLFGSPLLTAMMALSGAMIAEAAQQRWKRVTVAAVVILLSMFGGFVAANNVKVVDTIDVAVVQGGGPQNTRAALCENRKVFERHMTTSYTIDREVDLVVWPEDVVHPLPDAQAERNPCDEPLLSDTEATERISQLAQDLDATVITGWFERSEDGLNNVNYSIVTHPDGTFGDHYEKVRLVPFGEFVPLRGLIESVNDDIPGRDVRPGTEPAVLDTEVGLLGVSISWEIFFDGRARDAISNGGRLLYNPTNGSSYWLTIVQTQQVASSRLRAMETNRWVLQAAPTGFSAVVTPDGEVLHRTSISESAVIYETVELRTGETPGVTYGVWPMLILSIAILVLGGRRARAVGSATAEPDPPAESPTTV